MVAQPNRSKGANDEFSHLPAPASGSRQIQARQGASVVRMRISQEHTPVSRLSCAWRAPHAEPETTTKGLRLASSRLSSHADASCRNARNPRLVQPTTAHYAPRLITQDMACLHLRPSTNHASPDQARMGRIGCVPRVLESPLF